MVYSGHICFYGIRFDDIKVLELFLKQLLAVRPDVRHLMLLAQKYDPNSPVSKISKDALKLVFNYVTPGIPTYEGDKFCAMEYADWLTSYIQDNYPSRNVDGKQLKTIEVGVKRCCYEDGTFFLGFDLGTMDVVYREEVRSYNHFDKYESTMRRKIDKIKHNRDKIDPLIEEKLQSMLTLYYNNCPICDDESRDVAEQHLEGPCYCDINQEALMVFTYANDCESCS